MTSIRSHPLVQTLLELKGNPRACVYTEPMFGIAYNLFAPYASVYMLALGVKDQQIGLIASLNMAMQILTALLSGALTDKLGRRLTLLLGDLFTWSVPCLIWAIAQDFRYFLVAALFNGVLRISHTAWTCLMVEDAQPEQMVHIWTWVYISSYGTAFLAPLSGLLVNRLSLVPAMRVLYAIGFIVLTAKFLVLYRFSHETRRGGERREEARQQSLVSLLKEYRGVFAQLLRARPTLLALGLMLVMNIYMVVNSSFWSVLVTEKLLIPADLIPVFTFLRAFVMLGCFFWLTPRLTALRFRPPMALGFVGFIFSQILLVSMPAQNYPLLVISTILEAFSTAMISPLLDSLLALTMDARERARLMAIVFVVLILFTSPFGWVAGQLSAMNRTFPFIFNIGLFVIGGLLVWASRRLVNVEPEPELEAA